MSKGTDFTIRLSKAMREFNVGRDTIIEFLVKKGFQIDSAPNTKLTKDMYELLVKKYQGEKAVKEDAKKMGNLSYKGDSVSFESTFESDKEKNKEKKDTERTLPYQEPTSEGNEVEKEILISLSKLNFGRNYMSIKHGSLGFYLFESGISTLLNSEKSLNDISTSVLLDYPNHTFQFLDPSILPNLKEMSALLKKVKETEKLQKQIENFQKQIEKEKGNKERKEIVKTQIEHEVSLSTLKFGQGFVSITYKGKCYVYKDSNIKDYDKVLELIYSRISKAIKWFEKMAKQGDAEAGIDIQSTVARKNKIRNAPIKILIDFETETFTFTDIDIHKYINDLKECYLTEYNDVESNNGTPSKKNPSETPSTALKLMMLEVGNIHFYNGYYLIFHTNNGEIDNSIVPYRVNDPDSNEMLNLVHKYFEQILEQKRIIVKYDETKILEPSRLDLFQLSNCIRDLKRNLDVKGAWWKEVQNDRKPSLSKCRKISSEIVKKKVSLKNGYLDNLASMQSEKKLISVYEVNHGKEEDAFMFTISMSNNRCAIIFENASNDASTTTWVFVAKMENYEPCVNLVFDYFTDYTLFSKRSTLRTKTINPPEKFKAEDYTFIDHDDLGQWLKKLNKILEQTAEPSDIAFVPGLHIPERSETRTGHGDTIITKHLHNQLMRKLYDSLCVEHGKDNVGTEIRTGTKRIDCVVKGDGFYNIYEIKTAENPFECVTEALGQLCQYTYLFCRDKIGKMVIVGPSKMTKEVKEYLSWFRKNYSLQLYYMKV